MSIKGKYSRGEKYGDSSSCALFPRCLNRYIQFHPFNALHRPLTKKGLHIHTQLAMTTSQSTDSGLQRLGKENDGHKSIRISSLLHFPQS